MTFRRFGSLIVLAVLAPIMCSPFVSSVPARAAILAEGDKAASACGPSVDANAAGGTPAAAPESSPPPTHSAPSVIFGEDFDTFGAFHGWIPSENTFVVQQAEVYGGHYAARATSDGLPAFAQRTFDAVYDDIYYRIRFNVLSLAGDPVNLLRLRTDSDRMIASLYVSSGGTLGVYNHVADKDATSDATVVDGQWHEAQIHLRVDGRDGLVEVWLDGEPISPLGGTTWLGEVGVGRIDLGDNSGARIYDIAYDDVIVGTAFIASDQQPPPTAGVLTVRVFPPWTGIGFDLDGETFLTDKAGVARIEVARWSTDLSERIEAPPVDLVQGHLEFDGWHDWSDPLDSEVTATFDLFLPVTWTFTDQDGRPTKPELVTALTFRNSIGEVQTFTGDQHGQPQLLEVGRPVRHQGAFTFKDVNYSVESACVGGANVVNQGQQSRDPSESRTWVFSLLFYSARVQSRDAFFGTPIGAAVRLTYPDGTTHDTPLDSQGMAVIEALPRGEYQVSVIGGGYSPPRPLALTQDQEISLTVISRLDMALGGGLLTTVGLGLLLIGRPSILLAPFRLIWPFRDRRQPTQVLP